MRIRSAQGMRRYRCPYCALRVLGDDASLTMHHEAPVCEAFKAKLVELGLRPIHVAPTAFVDVDGKSR